LISKARKILFVCVENSCRSQMAEAFVNVMAPGRFQAFSAGIEPGRLNPIVVQAMQDIGIDMSSNKTKSVQDFIDAKQAFDYIITVCAAASGERCPVFSGQGTRIHMGFEDPSSLAGSDEEKLRRTSAIRDQIKNKIQRWLKEYGND